MKKREEKKREQFWKRKRERERGGRYEGRERMAGGGEKWRRGRGRGLMFSKAAFLELFTTVLPLLENSSMSFTPTHPL